jgi:tetratricopeptide (TPR) repeat protein
MATPFERRLGDGRLNSERGDLERARVAYDDAVQLASTPTEEAEARAALGVVLDRAGDGRGAEAELRAALELPTSAPADRRAGWQHDLGIVLLRRGRPGQAVSLLADAARDTDDDLRRARSVEALGHALLELDRLREAESAFVQLRWLSGQLDDPDRAVRAENGHGEALRRLGRAAESWERFEAAVQALAPVISPTPGQSEQAGVALHGLGVLAVDEEPERAATLLTEAVKCFEVAFQGRRHPHVARSLAFLGWLQRRRGQADQAEATWAEVRAIVPPDHPIVTDLLATLTARD